MKLFAASTMVFCVLMHTSLADKPIQLEDIEHDNLLSEGERGSGLSKELISSPTQHIQLSYSNDPQDVFATPPSGSYPQEQSQQLYHLPEVHEAEQTYSSQSRQSLLQPIIGGSQPIQPALTPQQHYIYVPSPHQPQSYIPQAHAYVMLPYASQHQQPQLHYTSQLQQQPQIQLQEQHAVLPEPAAPTQQVYSYSHGGHASHAQAYQQVKSLEYSSPSNIVTPLQTSVDYKPSVPVSYSPKKPSAGTTTFQQYYSPGFEYHYTETVPTTKLGPQQSYSYSPSHNYQQSYVQQQPSYSYYHSHTPSTASIQSNNVQYSKHQSSSGLLDSYVPSLMSYAKQQQLKNYYSSHQQQLQQHQQQLQQHQQQLQQHQQQQYTQSHQVQQVQQQAQQHYNPIQHQQLFTPAQTQSHYAPSMTQYTQVQSHNYSPYPSSSAYNTIQYSVPMPVYDHSKRSTAKSTASLKALKSSKKA